MAEKIPPEFFIDVLNEVLRERRQMQHELAQALDAGNLERGLELLAKLAGVPPAQKQIIVTMRDNVAWELQEMKEK